MATVLRSRASRLACWFCLAAGGCAEQPVPAPRLEALCLKEPPPECTRTALAGEQIALLIVGRDLTTTYTIDLGDTEAPQTLGQFHATLGDVPLQNVEPGPVREGLQTLQATLPGELGPGSHTLLVETPGGQQATLADAFTIESPLQLRAQVHVARAPAGGAFLVSATLENSGHLALVQVTLELTQEGTGSLRLPDPPAPLTLEAGIGQTLELAPLAESVGPVWLRMSATAVANSLVTLRATPPAQALLTVLEPAVLSATASLAPATLPVNGRFQVLVEVTCAGQTSLQQVTLLPITAQPGDLIEMDPVAPRGIDLEPGTSRTLGWSGLALAPGVADLAVSVSAVEAGSGRELGPLQAGVLRLTIE